MERSSMSAVVDGRQADPCFSVEAAKDVEDHSARLVSADGNDRPQISALREIFTQCVERSGVALSL
jgi:hypothetical protein